MTAVRRPSGPPGEGGGGAWTAEGVERDGDLANAFRGKAQPSRHPLRVLPRRCDPLPPRHVRREPHLVEHGDGVVDGGGWWPAEAVEALPQWIEPRHGVLVEHLDDGTAAGG